MALQALLDALLFSWLAAAAAAAEPIAVRPDCATHCVNMMIPFPFGIGPRECLRRANLTVMEISVSEGTVKVMSHVTFANCTDKNETRTMMRQGPDLRGSPFRFSLGRNRAFTTNFTRIRSETKKNCRYAFLVDKKWFDNEPTVFRTIRRNLTHVPVVLEWEIYNTTRQVFGTRVHSNMSFAESGGVSGYLWDESGNYVGHTNSTCRYLGNNSITRLQCYCKEGYSGNPYLLRGCRDIDECKDSNIIRSCPMEQCVNYNGYYSCTPPPTHKMSQLSLVFIGLGSGLGALFSLGFGVWSHKFIKKREKSRRRDKFFKQNGGPLLQQRLSSVETSIEKTKLYKSKELEKATDKFNENRILSQGGQGTLYKGMLADGKIVAVKKSKMVDGNKLAEFINEIITLLQIDHRNVVKLLGCCLETKVPLLVYEYIPNRTLSQYIHYQNEDFPLTWEMRIRIATEVAGALSYFHSSASFSIFHRDIKSSNILLDEKYRLKVADFGTSRSVAMDQTHLTTSIVHGDFGYLDPEYFQSSQFTDKRDGVMLVELLKGQKPIILLGSEGGRSLATQFMLSMEDDCLFDIVDARVAKEGTFADLAKRCLNLSRKLRPAMKEVSSVLEDIQRSVKSSNVDQVQNSMMVDEDGSDQVVEPYVVDSRTLKRSRSGDSRMMLLIVNIIITYSLGLFAPTLSASEGLKWPVAKPGCQDHCGNVAIPFPFGIGSQCAVDKWFEIECNNSAPFPRLFLRHSNLEVLNITNSDFQVRNPISFYNCEGKEARQPLNLTGTPFYISSDSTFVAVSCGIIAKLISNSTDNYDSSSGSYTLSESWCTSICSTGNISYNILCNGTDCCEINYPSIDRRVKISFDNRSSTTSSSITSANDNDQCKYAFLVDLNYWSDYKNHSAGFTTIRDGGFVPLTLYWKLNYSDFDLFKKNMSMYAQETMTQYCYSGTPLDCYCREGLRGNPYLLNGCIQDINECEEYNISCGPGGRCMNTHGGYHCSYKNKFIFIGFGSALGALILPFGTWGLYKLVKKRKERRRRKKFFKKNGGLLLQQQMSSEEGNVKKTKLFSSNELTKATDHFSRDRILGQGGQGTVYKGMLEDGKIVAVKKSKVVDEEKLSEFINEVVILSQINHRNVVQLLGCCLETEVPLLVYEFIPNGTLSQYIHEQNEEFPFTWKVRLRVAAEVAGALSYLHSAASFPIYHRDIKSTNILLDEKYRAKVADFGTSRTITIEQTHLTTLVYGTFGYLDPEYFQSSQFTEKSDVYSFGVVLVELLTGRKAICATMAEEGRNLATYFTMSMEANHLFDIVDAKILEEGAREEILIFACLALRCLSLSGRNRPTMKEVAMELEGLQKSEREAPSNSEQNYEEIEYVRTELIEPWDVVSMSTGSSAVNNMTSRPSLQQEIPLLSFESKRNIISLSSR